MGSAAQCAQSSRMDIARAQCTQVFLVEDSVAIRKRLVEMISAEPGVIVIGEADSAKSAIEGILRTHPGLVVLDIRLTEGSGMEVLRKIKPLFPDIVFAMLSNHAEPQYRKAYLQAGASFFLDKTNEFEKIKDVIASVVNLRAGRTGI